LGLLSYTRIVLLPQSHTDQMIQKNDGGDGNFDALEL